LRFCPVSETNFTAGLFLPMKLLQTALWKPRLLKTRQIV
jgi:hypothetical protein